MTVVALIGGIGCGKSTVTELLAAKGASVVDADLIARHVVEIGSPTLGRLVATFGEAILTPDGALDRERLATLAFADPAATKQMNEVLHPEIGRELVRQTREAIGRSQIVVVVIPLFRAEHRTMLDVDTVVCVDCDPGTALDRLVEERGLAPGDAARRMAAQDARADRLALADVVLDNSGSLADLTGAVDALWDRLVAP